MTTNLKTTHKYREEWLTELVQILNPRLSNLGYGLPEPLRISCGFPSSRALAKKRQRIGECWGNLAAADGSVNIFISPVLEDPLGVAETVVHELGHASLGVEVGHKTPFKTYMKVLGLRGKPTATYAGEELKPFLDQVCLTLGPYPNSRIYQSAAPVKKQLCRQLKVSCTNPDEHADPYIARVSQKCLTLGPPTCPCGNEMVAEEREEDDTDESV